MPGADRGTPRWLNPVIFFPALWCLGVALAQIPLLSFHRGWSWFAWVVVLAAPLAFAAGFRAAARTAARCVDRFAAGLPPTSAILTDAGRRRRFRIVLIACVAIGLAELGHQFLGAGSVPLLSGNVDAARASQPGGVTVVLTNLLTVATICALVMPPRLLHRDAGPEILIAVVASGGFLLGGGRGPMLAGLTTAALARVFLRGLPARRVVVGLGLALFAVIEAGFFYRTHQHRGAVFESELYNEVLPGLPSVLDLYVPIHVGLATNFDVLAQFVDMFPARFDWGYGAYSMSGLDAVVPGARSLETLAGQVTSPFITSTAAGPFWADFGIAGVIVGMGLFGAVSAFGHALATRKVTPFTAATGAYLIYNAAFGVYANLYTQHPDWIVVLLGLAGVTVLGGEVAVPAPRVAASRIVHALRTRASAIRTVVQKRSVRIAVGGCVVAILVAAAAALQGERDPGAGAQTPGPFRVAARRHLPINIGGDIAMTDGDLPTDNSSIWTVPRRPSRSTGMLTVSEINFAQPQAGVVRSSIRVPASSMRSGADVGVWDGRPALFAFDATATAIGVRVTALTGPAPVRMLGSAPTAAPTFPGARRTLAVATWSGRLADLFVVTWGAERERAQLQIFSGESSFSQPLLTTVLPLTGLVGTKWAVEIARGPGRRPNLIATLRSAPGKHRPEVHVLSGDSLFTRFAIQNALATTAIVRGQTVLGAAELGKPAVIALDPRSADARVVVYGAPVTALGR